MIGPVDLRQSDEHPFLGREIAQPRQFSEATADAVDQAVRQLLQDSEARAVKIIRDRRPAIERLVRELESKETLSADEIDSILKANGGHETAPQGDRPPTPLRLGAG